MSTFEDEGNNPVFERTCNLIYLLASSRIADAYSEWQRENESKGLPAGLMQLYPQSKNTQNVIGRIIKGERTEDNPYLITPNALSAVVENLDFADENEVLWGSDVGVYFQELFSQLILDMGDLSYYRRHWLDADFSNNHWIWEFYQGCCVNTSESIERLKDDFVDFAFNTYQESSVENRGGLIDFKE